MAAREKKDRRQESIENLFPINRIFASKSNTQLLLANTNIIVESLKFHKNSYPFQ